MKANPLATAVAVLLICLTTGAAEAAPPLLAATGAQGTLAPMLEEVVPGVVNISTTARVRLRENPLLSDPFFRRFFGLRDQPRERETQSTGSGVIVDAKNGYVITNYHVIEDADEIIVTLNDGRRMNGELIGVDPEVDLAVIHIDAEGLTEVSFGDSDQLRVGDIVVAIGNPFGLSQTVTSGIVSALGRTGLGIEGYEDFIQTDASINPGNSGGALVNLAGRLVGINTAIVGASGGNVGIGFAIPSNMARVIMAQLVEYGEVRRGQLGVVVQDLSPELAQAFGLQHSGGALVTRVVADSPADEAGLQPSDVITAVNGQAVRNASQLRNAIGLLRVGAELKLEIIRDGRSRVMRAQLVSPRQAKIDAGRLSKRLAGAYLAPIERGHPLSGRVQGVQVVAIENASPAWNAGLREKDIIVSINQYPINALQDIPRAIARSSQRLLLNILRGEAALLLVIR